MSTMEFYVSTLGNDTWSGRLAEPEAAGTDGPWATLGQARDALCALKQGGGLSGPVTVWVRGGRYALAAPLTFTPADSGPITYAAYAGEQPVIDGGQRIVGWQEVELGGRCAWRTVLPEVAAGRIEPTFHAILEGEGLSQVAFTVSTIPAGIRKTRAAHHAVVGEITVGRGRVILSQIDALQRAPVEPQAMGFVIGVIDYLMGC
jgi:hypothetical protein